MKLEISSADVKSVLDACSSNNVKTRRGIPQGRSFINIPSRFWDPFD